MLRKACALVALVMLTGAALGADLGKAKRLMAISDYAAAVAELHELALAEPTRPDVRLLMATCFAECGFDLWMPGAVQVGRSNTERAVYQLQILGRIGETGRATLLAAITDGGERLSPLAIQAAAGAAVKEAVGPIAKVIARAGVGEGLVNTGVQALAQIKGQEAAAAIRARLAGATPRRKGSLVKHYLDCLDDKALTALAATEKDTGVVSRLGSRRSAPVEAHVVIVKRTDLEDAVRTRTLSALRRTLGETDGDAYVSLLIELQKDASRVVRWVATQGLSRAAPEKAVPALVAALGEERYAREAARTLQRLRLKAAVAPLMKVLEARCDVAKFKDWHVGRDVVYRAVVDSGAEGETLLRAAKLMMVPDPSRPSRPFDPPRAHRPNVPNLPDEHRAAVLARLLTDKDPAVRRAAARGLGRLDAKDAVARAAALLKDPDAEVRTLAADLLLKYARDGWVKTEQLVPLLASDNERVLRSAAQLLAVKPERAAVAPFLALLNDEDRASQVIGSIAVFFSRMPDKRAGKGLIAAVTGDRPKASITTLAEALKQCAADRPAAARAVGKDLRHASSARRRDAAVVLGILGEKSVLADLVAAGRTAQSTSERAAIDHAIRKLTGGL